MRLFTLLTVTATLLGAVSAASLAVIRESECAHEEIVHTTYIGQDKNVKFQVSRCDDEALTDPNGGLPTSLTTRQTASACGILCSSVCEPKIDGGPAADDCAAISAALVHESQKKGDPFDLSAFGTPGYKAAMQFKTCLTTVYNHRLTHLTFCLTDWSEIVTSISSSCPTDTDGGSNGGVCGAKDLEYDVRVQRS